MPAALTSADIGKAASACGSNAMLCVGNAGMVQQEVAIQLGANPPRCMSLSQPGQRAPERIPACAGSWIGAAIATFDIA